MPDGTRQVTAALRRTDDPPLAGPGRLRGLLTWSVAIVGPTAVWVGAFALMAAGSADEVGPEECHGIGWGCVLTPRESVWLTALVLGVFVLPLATMVTIGLRAAARAPRGEKVGAAARAVAVAVVAVLGLIVLVQLTGRY